MRISLKKFVFDTSASLTTTFAVAAPVLGGCIALGIDIGRAELAHKQAQRAAEAAAVSAAVAYQANNNNNLATEATQVAARFGFTSANGSTITVNRPPSAGSNTSSQSAVEVIVQQPQSAYFGSLIWPGALAVTGRAVAKGGPNVCVLALDTTASGAVGTQGAVAVNASTCSIYSNSSSSSSVSVGGSSSMSTLSVSTVGGVSGQSGITTQNGISTHQSATADPYAGVALQSYSGCTASNAMYKYTEYLLPGVYCGGMTLNAGANVTLSPGVYVMDGGTLTVNGGATLQGSGVTIVFTSSSGSNYATAKINGNATVNLTASSSEPYAGILFYGDRAMPTGAAFNLGGGSTLSFTGAVYLPKAAVSFSGNTSSSTGCIQFVVDTINFVGTAGLKLNCAGAGVRNIGAYAKVLE